jgi:hypothetical protein
LSRRLVELEVAVPQRLDGKQPSSLRPDGLRAGLHPMGRRLRAVG